MAEITKDSVLRMLPLRQRRENEEEILIGRPDISNFILLPDFAVDIIEMLDARQTVGDVGLVMEERFGEPVDIVSFAQDLVMEFQFVHTVDGVVVNEAVLLKDHLPWVTEAVGAFFFHRAAFVLYALLFASGLCMAIVGGYFPRYEDIFVSSSVVGSVVTAFLAAWVLLFLHEVAHLMAARSVGVGSRIGLSHRLFFMVAETNMSNIVLVEPARRYRAYCAGMGWDGALFGLFVWGQAAAGAGWLALPASVVAFLKMANVTLLMSIAFQLMFFMKTDIYYVFATRFDCKNLLHNTTLYLRGKIGKWSEEQREEWESVGESEKRVIRWYVWFYLLGFLWAVYFYVAYTLRQAIQAIVRTVADLSRHDLLSWPFFDGVLMIVLTLVPFGIVVWSWSKSLRVRRAAQKQRETQMIDG